MYRRCLLSYVDVIFQQSVVFGGIQSMYVYVWFGGIVFVQVAKSFLESMLSCIYIVHSIYLRANCIYVAVEPPLSVRGSGLSSGLE